MSQVNGENNEYLGIKYFFITPEETKPVQNFITYTNLNATDAPILQKLQSFITLIESVEKYPSIDQKFLTQMREFDLNILLYIKFLEGEKNWNS